MDWQTAFVLWTPIAVAALLLLAVIIFAIGILLFVHRIALGAWFKARWSESSTAHARTVAITVTIAWLMGLVGAAPPVPLIVVLAGWVTALAMFLKSDSATVAAQPGAQEGQIP